MQRLPTTVVGLVGDESAMPAAAAALDGQANVRLIPASGDALMTWREVVRSRSPFTVVTDDPLADVAEAWWDTFAGHAPTGRLEVAGRELAERVQGGTVDLPDVYVHLTTPEGDDRRSFHLVVLHGLAANRVLPAASAEDVPAAIRRIRGGRWWPEPDVIVAAASRTVPDHPAVAGRRATAELIT